jgi:hypothetical protein
MQPREEQGGKADKGSIPMHADGWVILSFITIACGYAFGVHMPKPIKERRRNR